MIQRAALTVLMRRVGASGGGSGNGVEVYLVARSESLRFFGGYLGFPGGAVDAGDGGLPLAGGEGLPPGERELVGAAARELFEETGVLAALAAAGGAAMPGGEALAGCRRALLDGGRGGEAFEALLRESGLAIPAGAFRPLARLVTPRFSPRRFDAAFFLLDAGILRACEPEVLAGELAWGRWMEPASALSAWRRGEFRVAAPAVVVLEALAALPLEGAIEALRALPPEYEGSGLAIPMAPGYDLVPLETPPLPPEIPTTTFLIGCRRFIAVDPAPKGARGQDHLLRAVGRRLEAGDELHAVVLTHHHPDHVGALDAVAARYSPPVWAHPLTGELLGRRIDRTLEGGARIDLGEGPDGRPGWSLEVLHTPGHAEGHIALLDRRHRSIVAGDLVSTLVSMYVGSPGGNLRDYFASLERLLALDLDTLFPSHGPPSHRPRELIEGTLEHRRRRIEETLARLDREPRGVKEIAASVYPTDNPQLRPLHVRTTRAALEHLESEGRAVQVEPDHFCLSG